MHCRQMFRTTRKKAAIKRCIQPDGPLGLSYASNPTESVQPDEEECIENDKDEDRLAESILDTA